MATNFSCTENHQTLWDYCKVLIKEKSIQYAKTKAKERKNNLTNLENRLKILIDKDNESDNYEKSEIEKQIQNIYDFKAIGAQIRSRIEIMENNEKYSKLFFGLEKSRQTRKVMHSLKNKWKTSKGFFRNLKT